MQNRGHSINEISGLVGDKKEIEIVGMVACESPLFISQCSVLEYYASHLVYGCSRSHVSLTYRPLIYIYNKPHCGSKLYIYVYILLSRITKLRCISNMFTMSSPGFIIQNGDSDSDLIQPATRYDVFCVDWKSNYPFTVFPACRLKQWEFCRRDQLEIIATGWCFLLLNVFSCLLSIVKMG